MIAPYLLAVLVDEDRIIRLVFRRRYAAYREEEARLRAQIAQKNRALHGAIQEVETQASTLSHDLRRPIVSASEVLRQLSAPVTERLTADQSSLFELARESMLGALGTIDETLQLRRDVMRPERRAAVDLRVLIDSVRTELKDEIVRRDARIDDSLDLKRVFAEPDKLRAVVRNLLLNAISYVPADRKPRVTLHAGLDENRKPELSITDNGIGVRPEDATRIFERRQRGTSALDLQVPGAGVGLSVARQMARRWGGDIVLRKTSPRGSTFTLKLGADSLHATTSRLDSARIFVVDDDPLYLLLVEIELAKHGAHVTGATSGAEALEAYVANFGAAEPGALVIDVQLPDTRGDRLARAIQEQHQCRAPILLWSAAPQTTLLHEASWPHEDFILKDDAGIENLVSRLEQLV